MISHILRHFYLFAYFLAFLTCSCQQSQHTIPQNLQNNSLPTPKSTDSVLIINNNTLKKLFLKHHTIATGNTYQYQNGKTFPGYLFNIVDRNDTLLNTTLAKMAGTVPIIKESPFSFINPKFVEWGIKNLIPEPNDSLAENSFQDLYAFYAKHFRLYYLTMRWLESSPQKLDKELHDYKQAIAKDSLSGGLFLEERYKSIQLRDVVFSHFFDESIAIGFWLRRYWDGSYNAFKEGLFFLMKKYDKEYLDDEISIRKQIRSSMIEGLDPEEYSNDSIYVFNNDVEFLLKGLLPSDNANDIYFILHDTLLLPVAQYLGRFHGELTSISILKKQSCPNTSITIKGKKALFGQIEEGKGGVGPHNEFPILISEEIEIIPTEAGVFKIPDIFNDTKFKWSQYSKDQLQLIQTLPQWSDGSILPHSVFLNIMCQNHDSTLNKKHVIHILYGYGD
jgi:hypothetical protein